MKNFIPTCFFFVLTIFAIDASAQTIAIYPVRMDGFTLNESEVTEISRIAMQACFEEGLTCLPRGYTLENIQKEQAIAGSGQVMSAPYIAEFALVGKTKEKTDVGVEGMRVLGGVAKNIGGAYVGAGADLALKGMRISANGMDLSGQVFRTNDGAMVFSNIEKKLGMSGEFIIVSGRSSNAQKLLSAFKKMFRDIKGKITP